MSFMNDNFPGGKYLKAEDLVAPLDLTIESVSQEQLRDGATKPVVFFRGETRSLILNKTNAKVLVAAFDDDEKLWEGKVIRLVREQVDFGGKRVDAIRVQIPDPAVDGDGLPF